MNKYQLGIVMLVMAILVLQFVQTRERKQFYEKCLEAQEGRQMTYDQWDDLTDQILNHLEKNQ